jgi:hypothetical protein
VNLLQVLRDAIEALIAAGDLGRAVRELEELERTARPLGIASACVRAPRCRGLLSAAERAYTGAFAAFDDALTAP